MASSSIQTPAWAIKAQGIINEHELFLERQETLAVDSEIHEVDYDEEFNDRNLSSLFVDHDPSQCIDRSANFKSWQDFVEDRGRPKHTILEDLPEDIYKPDAKKPTKRYDNAMASLCIQTLRFLAKEGDKEAQRILNFREGQLARSVGAEIIIEEGERSANGKLVVTTRIANGQLAKDIREMVNA
jgi:hypothetical protein